jgi:hypothetical protein
MPAGLRDIFPHLGGFTNNKNEERAIYGTQPTRDLVGIFTLFDIALATFKGDPRSEKPQEVRSAKRHRRAALSITAVCSS